MNCLAYSPDGQYIVTGGDDGKVKLWNTLSGFSTLTFHEHTSSISGVLFSHNRKFIASASLDGTVRAYDLARYRNFRTLTSPRPVQFSCLALDASDEFLAAGGQDFFDIYLWSMKLGSLLEVLFNFVNLILNCTDLIFAIVKSVLRMVLQLPYIQYLTRFNIDLEWPRGTSCKSGI